MTTELSHDKMNPQERIKELEKQIEELREGINYLPFSQSLATNNRQIYSDIHYLEGKIEGYKQATKDMIEEIDKIEDGCCGTCIFKHCDCAGCIHTKGIGCKAEEYCILKELKKSLGDEK